MSNKNGMKRKKTKYPDHLDGHIQHQSSPHSTTQALPIEPNSKVNAISVSPNLLYTRNEEQTNISDVISSATDHTINSVVRYLEFFYPQNSLGIRDLSVSHSTILPGEELSSELHEINPILPQDLELPPAQAKELIQHGYTHFYERKCKIQLSPGGMKMSLRNGAKDSGQRWYTEDVSTLALLTFRYASKTKFITNNAKVQNNNNLLLCLFKTEFRTIEISYDRNIVAALEEKDMTTLSGKRNTNFPDFLKLSTLAGLHNELEMHTVEVFSSMGKHYRFHCPCSDKNNDNLSSINSLKVTITSEDPMYQDRGITKIRIMRENLQLHIAKAKMIENPTFHLQLIEEFRVLEMVISTNQNSDKLVARGTPSKHHILLDKSKIGRVYINGRFVTEWTCTNKKLATHCPALFGFDLVDINVVQDKDEVIRIIDYHKLKASYAQAIQEILVDANQKYKNFAGKLLSRLINDHDEDEIGQELDESKICASCLETEVISNPEFDALGISARALATHFSQIYGSNAFPCVKNEVHYVKDRIGPHRVPILVPQRAIIVLRRGGFFDLCETEKYLWFHDKGSHLQSHQLIVAAKAVVQNALLLIQQAEKKVVDYDSNANVTRAKDIIFVKHDSLCNGMTQMERISNKFMCRFNEEEGKFYVNEAALFMQLPSSSHNSYGSSLQERAYILGLYIVKEHQNPQVLPSYVMCRIK